MFSHRTGRYQGMAFDREGETYEGLQFAIALGMAFMESSGIRKMIGNEVPEENAHLSTDMAAKAMIGTMYSEGMRKALYGVHATYATAPVDKLFGPRVKHTSLSDTTLAKRLDAIFPIEMDDMIWKSRDLLCSTYSLGSDVFTMDATNFPFYGIGYNDRDDDGAMPKYSKNSKTKRNDLMQKCVQGICDGNGVLAYTRTYDGNTSDVKMNRDSLEFLKERVDCSRSTVSGDCKMCTFDLIKEMMTMNMGFVTKVPSSFSYKVRDDVITSALAEGMHESNGRHLFDTENEVKDEKNGLGTMMRFVAYRLPDSVQEAEAFLRGHGLKDMTKRMTSLKRNAYFCEEDAVKAFSETLNGGYAQTYNATAGYVSDERLIKKDPDGPHWRIRPGDVTVNENAIAGCADRYSVNVLITNLPKSKDNAVNLRNGANADGIVNMYLSNFRTEHSFKLLKSGTGMARMFLHTPSRQDAVVFLSSLATTMSNVINAVLKRNGIGMTMKHISKFMMTSIVRYDRDNDRKFITGGPGASKTGLKITDALNVDPELLLGYVR